MKTIKNKWNKFGDKVIDLHESKKIEWETKKKSMNHFFKGDEEVFQTHRGVAKYTYYMYIFCFFTLLLVLMIENKVIITLLGITNVLALWTTYRLFKKLERDE